MVQKQTILGAPLLLLTLAGTYFYLDWYYTPLKKHERRSQHPSDVPVIVQFQEKDSSVPKCINLTTSGKVQQVQGWHRVPQTANNSLSEWYVYSAHADNRSGIETVRILALSKGDWNRPMYCRFGTTLNNSSPVPAKKQELWIPAWDSAKPGQYYHPFLLTCPVPKSLDSPVSAVSIEVEACSSTTYEIRLAEPKGPPGEFVVCLKPLNFKQDVSIRLLEWLELQYILGADRVHTYVHELHPKTWTILKHYKKLGKLEWEENTFPEELWGKEKPSLWQKRRYEMALYNDCFYRHIHSHQYVVNLDLDEAIVPLLQDSWPELLAEEVESSSPGFLSASLSVRNVYFFDAFGEVDNDSSSPSSFIPKHMHMLRHVVRSANFTPAGFAQKSFFSTRLAEIVSNHFALRATRSDVRLLGGLDIGKAHMHHYRRECPPLMEKECEENYMRFRERDTLLWKFKDRLVRNVLDRIRELGIGPFVD